MYGMWNAAFLYSCNSAVQRQLFQSIINFKNSKITCIFVCQPQDLVVQVYGSKNYIKQHVNVSDL